MNCYDEKIYTCGNCRFDGFENEGNLKVPILYDTLKYFYSNYNFFSNAFTSLYGSGK